MSDTNQQHVCDSENPEPEISVALVSNECPIHNLHPREPEAEIEAFDALEWLRKQTEAIRTLGKAGGTTVYLSTVAFEQAADALEQARARIAELEVKNSKLLDGAEDAVMRTAEAQRDLDGIQEQGRRANDELRRIAGLDVCSKAAADVLAERRRQIEVEGWFPERDDHEHDREELARAAYCYTGHYFHRGWQCAPDVSGGPAMYTSEPPPPGWPWAREWWKPKNPRRDLVRAAALLIAEIERLDRAEGEQR